MKRVDWEETARMWRRMTIYAVVIIISLCFILISVLLTADAADVEPVEIEEEPPVVVDVLDDFPVPDVVAVDPLEDEKIAIAQTVWGEARGCDLEGQENVVWTILNRYDNGNYGDSLTEVVSAPYQFAGYSPDHPVDADIMVMVDRVVNRWLDGDPGPGYLYFYGDGTENHFSKDWRPE